MCNERDILGMQLIKRNDELAQLYEKIKIQRAAISQAHTPAPVSISHLTSHLTF